MTPFVLAGDSTQGLSALTCEQASSPFSFICEAIRDHAPIGGAETVGVIVQHLVQAVVVFAIVYVAGRVLRRTTMHAAERSGADAQIRTLVNNVFLITTVTVAVLCGLTAGGLPITVLLTFGGLTSLALGLAFQDLLRNVLAGIFLLIERPFRIGDWITVGDLSGSVQTIELRTTALRTADGRLAIMPNVTAFNTTVVNASAYDRRRFSVRVRLPEGATMEEAVATATRVLRETRELAAEPAPSVQPRLEADGIVTLECRWWLEYRTHDADALAAALTQRLHDALGAAPSGA